MAAGRRQQKVDLSCLVRPAIFAGLSNAERDRLKAGVRQFVFDKRHVICRQGDVLPGVYFIREGKVKLACTSRRGKEAIIELLSDGGSIGLATLFSNDHCHVTAVCLERTEGCLLPKRALLELAGSSPKFAMNLLRFFAEDTHRKTELITSSHEQVISRVAHALLRLARTYGAGAKTRGKIVIPVRRDDLASLSGTTLESAVRCLGRLKKRGIIVTSGREIGIVNFAELAQLAGMEANGHV